MVSLFLDLSKAFNTVNHQILLNKLKYYGLQQSEQNWFRCYLCDRKQQVHVNGVVSELYSFTIGLDNISVRLLKDSA